MPKRKNNLIFVATHLALRGFTRVGKARSEADIHGALRQSRLPTPYDIQFTATVDQPQYVLDRIREIFVDRRVHRHPHLYRVDTSKMIAAVSLAAAPYAALPQPPETERPVRARRTKWDFVSLDIPLGATLEIKGNPEVKCTVVQLRPPMVTFDGEIMPPSTAANAAKGTRGLGWTDHWVYEGRIIRNRKGRLDLS